MKLPPKTAKIINFGQWNANFATKVCKPARKKIMKNAI